MEYRKFGDAFVVRIDKGEEIVAQVLELAKREHIALASVQALGAVNRFTAGVFDTQKKQFAGHTFEGCFEIVSLTGTLTTMDGKPYCHLHMSAGDEQGHVFGGHLNEAFVSATCEMVVLPMAGQVERAFDEETGLNLFRFL